MTQSMDFLLPRLDRLGEVAKSNKSLQFNNLFHHINPMLLYKAFYKLNRKAVKGVDDLGWFEYQKNVKQNIRALHGKLQSDQYKAQPVKRLWIAKPNGEKRPIGITAIEDKIVQQALVWVLEPIYESDFLGFSYGFRPNRNQHQALDAVYMTIAYKKVSWVLDADLKGFFDAIDHQWMMTFLSHRIADKRVPKLVKGWLRAGVMDEHTKHKTWVGTPQGAVISPLLANIYLHYALDLWVQQWRKRHARGDVYIIRYADDFIMGFQYKSDAEQFKLSLQQRLTDFKLSLNESKTQLIEFGRFAKSNRQARKENKPKTFDFLGFTHICSVRWGSDQFALLRVSIKKKLRAKIREIKETLRRNINRSPYEIGRWLKKVLTGYFNYFAVPRNGKSLNVMRTEVCKLWLKTLRRRSQKGRKLNWQVLNRLVRFFIPHTRIRHPYPNQRFHL